MSLAARTAILAAILWPAFAGAEDGKAEGEGEVFAGREFDEVVLNNGTRFRGTIQQEDDGKVVLKIKDSVLELTFKKGDEPESIKEIARRASSRGTFLAEQEAAGDDADKNYELAKKCKRSGMAKEYVSQLRRVIKLDSTHAAAHKELLAHCQEAGDYEGELDVCIKMRRAGIRLTDTAFRLGEIYQELGLREWALREYEAVLRAKPDHIAAGARKADLLRETGKLAEAVKAYDEVLEADPKMIEALHGRSQVAFARGRYRSAREDLEKALAANTKFYAARLRLGLVYLALGEPAEAIESLEQIPRYSPLSRLARLNVAVAEIARGNPGKAEELLKTYEAGQEPLGAKLLRGYYQEHPSAQDAPVQAVGVYQQVIRQSPGSLWGQLGLARTAAAAGQRRLAPQAFNLAIRLDPEFWPTHVTKGLMHLADKKFLEASRCFSKAMTYRSQAGLEPDADLLFAAGQAALLGGKPDDAKNWFADALRATPGHQAAKLAAAAGDPKSREFLEASRVSLESLRAKALGVFWIPEL